MPVEVNCSWCGKIKGVDPYRIKKQKHFFCDHMCYGWWKSENDRGESHPSWEGGEVEVLCSWCGKKKKVIPYRTKRSKHFFCGQACSGRWQSENRRGENHPGWEGGGVEVSCSWCGKKKKVKSSEIKKRKHLFCDHMCYGRWRSRELIGEKHPFWQGGKSFEPYTKEWTKDLRRSIRERDNHTCQLCGAKQADKALDVHHINYDKGHSGLENLISLCASCHKRTNANRSTWQEFFEAKMDSLGIRAIPADKDAEAVTIN